MLFGIAASKAVAEVAVGASFTGTTLNVNTSATLDVPSLATTFSGTEPLAFGGGVPPNAAVVLNVAVVGSNVSQSGNGEPSANDAARVRFGPSASLNVFAGIVNTQAASSFEL